MDRYTVLKCETSYGLCLQVNKLIKDGYRPQGGVSYNRDGHSVGFAQAMIKERNNG